MPDILCTYISDMCQHLYQISLKSEKVRLKTIFQYVDLTWNDPNSKDDSMPSWHAI
jgi:hypothetical protein